MPHWETVLLLTVTTSHLLVAEQMWSKNNQLYTAWQQRLNTLHWLTKHLYVRRLTYPDVLNEDNAGFYYSMTKTQQKE